MLNALMEITVKYYAPEDKYHLQERTLALQEKATIRDLLKTIGIGPEEATAIFRNGDSTLYSQVLSPGDVVTIMPFVSGG
jgi:sulfur carrier protein ThiS